MGWSWSAGEIGYLLVPGTSVKPVESGEPGALESAVGGEGIKAQWQNSGVKILPSSRRALDRDADLRSCAAGDVLAQSILHKLAQTWRTRSIIMAVVLNCPLFVLGGSVGLHPVFGSPLRKFLSRGDKRVQPKLLRSTLGPDAQVNGSVAGDRGGRVAGAFKLIAENRYFPKGKPQISPLPRFS